MNKVFLLSVFLLAGCQVAPRQPVDVTLIPDDCANRHAIIRWLEDSVKAPAPPTLLQKPEDHDRDVSAIKSRIWRMRYICQRV